jgi:hypothetical protein
MTFGKDATGGGRGLRKDATALCSNHTKSVGFLSSKSSLAVINLSGAESRANADTGWGVVGGGPSS